MKITLLPGDGIGPEIVTAQGCSGSPGSFWIIQAGRLKRGGVGRGVASEW